MKYIFDVDGTLTPSRDTIDPTFQRYFLEFCYSQDVYLVTGSDYPKTLQQLGSTICQNVDRIYNCNGNDVWAEGINIRRNNWTLPEDAHEWLAIRLTESKFYRKTGLHFEHRPGMVNFSIVGRNATIEERAMYREWDEHKNERIKIATSFNQMFPKLRATVGGETGLDIAPIGLDKRQILKDFNNEQVTFFGDRMDPDGNDYPLAQSIIDNNLGFCYNVSNWEETWKLLRAL